MYFGFHQKGGILKGDVLVFRTHLHDVGYNYDYLYGKKSSCLSLIFPQTKSKTTAIVGDKVFL